MSDNLNVSTPTDSDDIANKGYVDSAIAAAIATIASAVTSVNTQTGAVVLDCVDLASILTADATYTIGSTGDFATFKDARDFFITKLKLPGVIITLQGQDEIHNLTDTLEWDLGEGYNPIGVEYSLGFSSIASISGSAGNHTVTLNVTSSTNCAVGRFIKLRGTAGTGNFETLEGVWPITAVPSGTQVSIKVTDKRASIASTTISSLQECAVIRTVLKFSGCTGLKLENQLGILDRLAFYGCVIQGDETTADTYGIYGNDCAKAFLSSTRFGVYGFKDHNIYGFRDGHISFSSVASCNSGGHGAYLLNGAQGTAVRTISNGNTLDGLVIATGAQVECGLAVTCGNGSDGISSSTGGNFIFSGKSKYNVGKAINAADADVFIAGADIEGEVYLKDCRGYVNNSIVDGDLNSDSPEVKLAGNTVLGKVYGAEKAIASSVAWASGTAPSGTTNNRYQFSRSGNKVSGIFRLEYATAGSGVTGLTIDLPSDMPTPALFTGQSAGDVGFTVDGWLTTSNTTLPTAIRCAQLALNGSTWQISITGTPAAYIGASFNVSYFI